MGQKFHIFFLADNLLLFCKATTEEAQQVIRIIQSSGRASEQDVNIKKLSLFLSKNFD